VARFGDNGSLRGSQGALKQEATRWILIAVLGFICVIGVYLLWLKASGDCGSCQVPFGALLLRAPTWPRITVSISSYSDKY